MLDSIVGSARIIAAAGIVTISFNDGVAAFAGGFEVSNTILNTAARISMVGDASTGLFRIPLGAFTATPTMNLVMSGTGLVYLTVIWHLE